MDKQSNILISFALEIAKLAIFISLVVIPVRYFVFCPFVVKGASMHPMFEDGDYLLVDEISLHFKRLERGEAIVFKFPKNPSEYYIKRVIGLPGEHLKIEQGKIFIFNKLERNWEEIQEDYLSSTEFTAGDKDVILGEEDYFVLGDNRQASSDSRVFGLVSRKYIVGRVWIRAWPFNNLAYF